MISATLVLTLLTQAPIATEDTDMPTIEAQAIIGLNYLCQNGEQQRKVQVLYPQGTQVPCEVNYIKTTGNKTLWRANNEIGYCEAKASSFAQKLAAKGWHCSQK